MARKLAIPLDVLLVIVLIPGHLHAGSASYVMAISLLVYVLFEWWHPLVAVTSLPTGLNRTRFSFLIRLFLLLMMLTGATILPTLNNILARQAEEIDSSGYAEAYAHMHDGAIQVEYALAYLNEGKNPYEERYEETPLRFFGFSGIRMPSNPAFDHFVYLPGFLITSTPIYRLFDNLKLPYDQRLVYLAAYVMLVLLLPTLVDRPTLKLSLLAAVALNPLLVGPVIIGMNDVLVLLFLFLSSFALSKRRYALSAALFGYACTLKQSAWFLGPFYMLLLFGSLPVARRTRRFITYMVLLIAVMIVVIGPFLLWNPSAFLTDTLAYPGGNVDVNYPIRGYTLGTLLVGAGIIASPLDSFPFWILQLVLGMPLLILTLRAQSRNNGISSMLLNGGIFLFGMGFASRFFQDNYVGFVTALITAGILLQGHDEDVHVAA